MQEGLVSVVVPIYNTEKYLDRCIESIVNQTYPRLEIILVDDGSPDNCPQICDAWAQKDSRIRVIHKQNGGLSSARNAGIENAHGEYICFFDSDDFVDKETIQNAVALSEKETADMVTFGFSAVNSQGEILKRYIPSPVKFLYSGEEVQNTFLPDLLGADPKTGRTVEIWMSACMCLISTELMERAAWKFKSEREIISEDVYFLLGLYKHVKKVVVLEEALYYYRENQTSVTRVYRPDRFLKVKHFYEECIKLCCECAYSKEVMRRCAEPFISFTIAAMKQEAAYHKGINAALPGIRKIVDDDVLQRVLQEKKKDKAGLMRRVLFWAMRNKAYLLCWLLLTAKNTMD